MSNEVSKGRSLTLHNKAIRMLGARPGWSKAHVWRLFPGSMRPQCKQCDLVWEAGARKPKGLCPGVRPE